MCGPASKEFFCSLPQVWEFFWVALFSLCIAGICCQTMWVHAICGSPSLLTMISMLSSRVTEAGKCLWNFLHNLSVVSSVDIKVGCLLESSCILFCILTEIIQILSSQLPHQLLMVVARWVWYLPNFVFLTTTVATTYQQIGKTIFRSAVPHLNCLYLEIPGENQCGIGPDGKRRELESNVLLASIENMQYAVTIDVLHTVCNLSLSCKIIISVVTLASN